MIAIDINIKIKITPEYSLGSHLPSIARRPGNPSRRQDRAHSSTPGLGWQGAFSTGFLPGAFTVMGRVHWELNSWSAAGGCVPCEQPGGKELWEGTRDHLWPESQGEVRFELELNVRFCFLTLQIFFEFLVWADAGHRG